MAVTMISYFWIGCFHCLAQNKGKLSPGRHITGYIEYDDDVLKTFTPEVIDGYQKADMLILGFFNPSTKSGDQLFIKDQRILATVDAINNKVHQDSSRRVLMSIGGQNKKSRLRDIAKLMKPENRADFIARINRFVLDHHFDGVDIDFENKELVGTNYADFLRDLNAVLKADAPHKILSVAVEGDLFHEQHMGPGSLQSVDIVNAMSYDLGKDNMQGQRAPYSFAERDLRYWTDTLLVPLSKLNLGLPFYGYISKNNGKPKQMPFGQIREKYPADTLGDSYQSTDNSIAIYYNGTATIKQKVRLANTQGLRGVMIWEIIYDDQNKLYHALQSAILEKD